MGCRPLGIIAVQWHPCSCLVNQYDGSYANWTQLFGQIVAFETLLPDQCWIIIFKETDVILMQQLKFVCWHYFSCNWVFDRVEANLIHEIEKFMAKFTIGICKGQFWNQSEI